MTFLKFITWNKLIFYSHFFAGKSMYAYQNIGWLLLLCIWFACQPTAACIKLYYDGAWHDWGHQVSAHTVSFDWFLSGLEWILNLEFCELKLWIFYQKLLWNIRSRLNSSIFWVFQPLFGYVLIKIEAFCTKNEDFDKNVSKYRLKNSKCGKVKPRSDIL